MGRYYPLFGLMANVALIFSGQYVKYVSGLRATTLAPGTLLLVVVVVISRFISIIHNNLIPMLCILLYCTIRISVTGADPWV